MNTGMTGAGASAAGTRRIGFGLMGVSVVLAGVVAVGSMTDAGQPGAGTQFDPARAPAEIDKRPKQQPAEKTAAPAAVAPGNAAGAESLTQLAFLKGTWAGDMHGDPVEESWSGPGGDSIMGMFRWNSGGKTTMYELLSIKDEGGVAVLRLRHFGTDFTPWKGECDGVAALKATEVKPNLVVFTNDSGVGGLAACRYECPSPDVLKVKVSFKDEKREALEFELKRQ